MTKGKITKPYLVRRDFQRLPVNPWKDVPQKGRIIFNVGLLKLTVLEVEWEGKRGCLARFDGASKEVDCEYLHRRTNRDTSDKMWKLCAVGDRENLGLALAYRSMYPQGQMIT